MKDLDNGEWMCPKCRKAWELNDYNAIMLCRQCFNKRKYL